MRFSASPQKLLDVGFCACVHVTQKINPTTASAKALANSARDLGACVQLASPLKSRQPNLQPLLR